MTSLPRTLGPRETLLLSLGAMLGGGVFTASWLSASTPLPLALAALGAAALLAWLNGQSAAALAAEHPQSGGGYEWSARWLSRRWAGVSGILFIFAKITTGAALLGLAHRMLPDPWGFVTAGVVLLSATGLNLAGLKKTAAVNAICLVLVGAALAGFWFLGATSPPLGGTEEPILWPKLAAASFLAFAGYARIATLAEEIEEPEKVIPRTVTISVVACLALYALSFAAWSGKTGSTPLWLGAGIMIAVGTSVLGQIAGLSRVMLAMGRRSERPSGLAVVTPKGVPATAVLAAGGGMLVGTIGFAVESLIVAGASALVGYYFLVNAAALKLPRGQVPIWIPYAGGLGCLVLFMALVAVGVWAVIAPAALVIFAYFGAKDNEKRPPPPDGKAG